MIDPVAVVAVVVLGLFAADAVLFRRGLAGVLDVREGAAVGLKAWGDATVEPETEAAGRATQPEPGLASVTEPQSPRPHLHPGTLLAVTEALAARREHYRAKLAGRVVATYDRIRAEGMEEAYTEMMHLVNELPRGDGKVGRHV